MDANRRTFVKGTAAFAATTALGVSVPYIRRTQAQARKHYVEECVFEETRAGLFLAHRLPDLPLCYMPWTRERKRHATK